MKLFDSPYKNRSLNILRATLMSVPGTKGAVEIICEEKIYEIKSDEELCD